MVPVSTASPPEPIEGCEKVVSNGSTIVDLEKKNGPISSESVPSRTDDKTHANSEVEYVESEDLADVEDVESSVKTLLSDLNSKDWVLICESLNNTRRLSIFHKDVLQDILNEVVPLIVKSLKNPRSGVCKTALMAAGDVLMYYNDAIIDFLDPLLVQLLLKASQDKKFVCDAAENALVAMTKCVSPMLLLPKLHPYFVHKNPRIRAKASFCFSRCVPRLGVEGIRAYGIEKLMKVAASQLSDQLPESREAARGLLLELQSVYEKSNDWSLIDTWEQFCHSNLSSLNAKAVLRVTSVAREGIVSIS